MELLDGTWWRPSAAHPRADAAQAFSLQCPPRDGGRVLLCSAAPIPMLSYPRARARGTGMGTEQPIMSPLGGS